MDNKFEKRDSVRRISVDSVNRPSKYDARMVNKTPYMNEYAERSANRKKRRRGLGFGFALLIDAVAIAAFLLTFAYFHHVNPIFREIDEPIALPAPEAVIPEEPVVEDAPVVEVVPEEVPEVSQEPAVPQHKFEDKFSLVCQWWMETMPPKP